MPSGVGRHPFHSDESIVALRARQLTIFASNYPTCVQVFYDLDQLLSRYEEINTHEPEEEITIIENPFPISEDAFCGFLHAARAQWVDLTASVRSCPQFSARCVPHTVRLVGQVFVRPQAACQQARRACQAIGERIRTVCDCRPVGYGSRSVEIRQFWR